MRSESGKGDCRQGVRVRVPMYHDTEYDIVMSETDWQIFDEIANRPAPASLVGYKLDMPTKEVRERLGNMQRNGLVDYRGWMYWLSPEAREREAVV